MRAPDDERRRLGKLHPVARRGPGVLQRRDPVRRDPYYRGDSDPFEITKEETVTTYTGPTVIAQGLPVTPILRTNYEEDTPVHRLLKRTSR